MIQTFAEKIIEFNKNIKYTGVLPPDFSVINPFEHHPETVKVMQQFYERFYNDTRPRKFIIGINPSRHGAAITGIPFTDTKRLEEFSGIEMESARTHEVSSVFYYDMIEAYGGVDLFYQDFYINSPLPLALVRQKKDGKILNANYYDTSELFNSLSGFMIEFLSKQFDFGLNRSEVIVLGVKNAGFIKKLNEQGQLFNKMTILEHPRYIQQYKFKERHIYIDKYVKALKGLK